MRVKFALVLVGALLIAACGGDSSDDESTGDNSAATTSGEEAVATTTSAAPPGEATTTVAGEPPAFEGDSLITSESPISTSGLGLIRTDMTQDEAEKAANDRMLRLDDGTDVCYLTELERSPGEITFIFNNGVLGAVVVDDDSVATLSGAQVGNTEQEILDLFGDKIVATDIADGRNLTFVPSDEGFEDDRVVFRTDGTLVVQIRSGRLPEVGAENGCADLQ